MNLTRIWAIFIRQVFLFTSNPTRLAGIFIWLIIDIIQWGFITKFLSSLGQVTFSFITFILGAIILWGFLARIQQGVMMAFLEDIWSQNFINIFASPLRLREYLGGMVLTSITTSISGFFVMAAVAGLAFGYNIFRIGVLLLPFMALLFIFGMAMGIFMSAVIFRLGPSAEWLGWPIPMVLSLFAGVYYPIATLPAPLQVFAKLVPPSYVFEGMRGVITGTMSADRLLSGLASGTVLSAVYLVLAMVFFNAVYRRNLKTGGIARFNAEAL